MIEAPANVRGLSLADVYAHSDSVSVAALNREPLASNVTKVLAMLAFVSRIFNGREIVLTSVVRSPERNASIPGASPYSHHVTGYAADFVVAGLDNAPVFEALKSLQPHLKFDELGIYNGHLHISADPRARGKVFDKRTQPERDESGAPRAGAAALPVLVALVLVVLFVALFAARVG